MELGINDLFRGIPPTATNRNLDMIVGKVRAKYPACKLALKGMELPKAVPDAGIHMYQIAVAMLFRKCSVLILHIACSYCPHSVHIRYSLAFSYTRPFPVTAEFPLIFRRLAEKYKMAFVPFFLQGVIGQPHLNFPDGIHPNAKGYQIIADNVWPVLQPLLQIPV